MSRSVIEYFEDIRKELEFLLTNSKGLNPDVFYEDEVLKRAFSRSLEFCGFSDCKCLLIVCR